jgi:hypothetical protein
MDYPFFFYQPWPLIMSAVAWTLAGVACLAAWRAWLNVAKMARMLHTMRAVLLMQQMTHEAEVRSLIERMGGEPINGANHTIQ